jgi:hypothetical protein
MSLREAYLGARIIETNDNYARADTPLLTQPGGRQSDEHDYYYDDRSFWERVFDNPEGAWGIEFDLIGTVLSEWVARVPGLFWRPEALKMREVAEEKITYVSNGWRVLHPPGKSEKVMGGIGTFRLPPAVDGTRLVVLTTTMNASVGVPALVFPDVWDRIGQHGPHEGRLLGGRARWQPMSEGWSARFKSTRDIPRGYLVLDDPDGIGVQNEQAPVQISPFTVMEYYAGAKELFDYVYAFGDTGDPNYRARLSRFFDTYKDDSDRYGRYLLGCDMIDAMWDAEYDSPGDLRRADPSAKPQLDLLEARVRERLLGEDKIEVVLDALGTTSDSDADVRRLSQDVGIPPAVWYRGGSLVEICSQFIQEIVRRNKLGELVDTFASIYPAAIA